MRTAYLNIGELVTMAGPPGPRTGQALRDIGIINNAGIVVENPSAFPSPANKDALPRIVAVGRSDEIKSGLRVTDRKVDLEGRLVVPAFVDSHTHMCFAGNRVDEWEQRAAGATYQEIAARGGGILSTVRATREATHEELAARVGRHFLWSKGLVALEVKSGYGLTLESELKMLRASREALKGVPHVLTFLGAHAVPPEAKSRAEYLDLLIHEMLPAVAGLAKYADMFVEEGYFTPDDCRAYAAAAQKRGMQVRLHVDQLQDGGGAQLAAEVGAVSADHLEQTNESGMRALAKKGVFAGLLPGSVFGIRSNKYPDARKMIDLGVPVCVATDFNPGSSPVASLPFCMRLAVDHMGMTPAEALAATTINAAHSLGLGTEVGSLEPGKIAAFLVHDLESHREIPYWIGARSQRGDIPGEA